MKILFVMRHSGYVRNFESTLRLLCDRGHTVHLAFQIAGTHWLLDPGDVSQQLSDRYRRFSRGVIPVREDAWGFAARELRVNLDYLRYLGPEYRNAPKLVERATRDVPATLLQRTQRGPLRTRTGLALASGWFTALHRAVPSDARIDAFLQAQQPDVLAVTPLIEPGAPQAEYLRSARALGIRSALCVASWDNLTNKGLIHGPPDLVTVWNEMMKREAVDLHGVPPERVAVTGAQPFDHWFDWQPSTSRDAFCGRVGLPADRPYLLYVCSSKFIAPDEVPFVRAWVHEMRRSPSPALQRAGVLVRPHPQNADQWRSADLRDKDRRLGGPADSVGDVVVWPPEGAPPVDDQSRADYFDSIYHSAAVVGINTTAEIESAIVGRGVYTMLTPEFRDTQDGTLHFDHLRQVNGGLLHVAQSVPEHLEQLDAALRDPKADAERSRRFVETFVRPHGIGVPATPKVVEALERLAQAPAMARARAPRWAPIVRPLLARKGERLQRDTLLALETKAARDHKKKKREEKKRAEKTAIRTWRELVPAVRALGYEDRVRFGQATFDCLPGELLLEHAKPERLDYPDAEIYLRVISKKERERLKACAKEPFTIDWMHRCVRAGEVLYDIGANVGAYSLVAAKKPSGAARVFAFEPSYANVASLCANIVLNEAADVITPMPFALANADGLSVLSLRALEPGSARHALGDGPSDEGPTLYRQPVVTFRLDEAIDRFGLPLPNHIKLDVDGGELDVIEGAARTLASPALRSVLVEVSTSLSDEITGILVKHGLALESKVDVRNTAGEYRIWYGLFTRAPQGVSAGQTARMHVVTR